MATVDSMSRLPISQFQQVDLGGYDGEDDSSSFTPSFVSSAFRQPLPAQPSLEKEGPNGYKPQESYHELDNYYNDIDRDFLMKSCYAKCPQIHGCDWGTDTLITIGKYFGAISTTPIGKGDNSSAFKMQPTHNGKSYVLRLFSLFQITHDKFSAAYKLDRNHIGGEWLNCLIDHPNIASSTHIVVWDNQDSKFKVMTQKEVLELLDNQDKLDEGRELYAVATVGDYVEGSHTLKQEKIAKKEELKPLLKQLFEGVAALNQSNICHRDLKASNVIILPSKEAKIIDFGTAGIQKPGEKLPFFGDISIHPIESYGQNVREAYTSRKTDSYSLFLIIYQLTTGADFLGNTQFVPLLKLKQLRLLEQEQKSSFQEILDTDPLLEDVEPKLKNLMVKLGTANAEARLTAEEALAEPYFAERSLESLVA